MFVDEFIKQYVPKRLRKQFKNEFFRYYPDETEYIGLWCTMDILYMLLDTVETDNPFLK